MRQSGDGHLGPSLAKGKPRYGNGAFRHLLAVQSGLRCRECFAKGEPCFTIRKSEVRTVLAQHLC